MTGVTLAMRKTTFVLTAYETGDEHQSASVMSMMHFTSLQSCHIEIVSLSVLQIDFFDI